MLAQRNGRAAGQDVHHRAADVVARMGALELRIAGENPLSEVVAWGVRGRLLRVTIQDDAGLLLVRERPVVVVRLLDDGQHDARFVLEPEPDQTVVLAKRSGAGGGLDRLLGCWRLGQVSGIETGAGPDLLEGGTGEAGLGEGPPDEVAQVFAAGAGEGGLNTFESGHDASVGEDGASKWLPYSLYQRARSAFASVRTFTAPLAASRAYWSPTSGLGRPASVPAPSSRCTGRPPPMAVWERGKRRRREPTGTKRACQRSCAWHNPGGDP